MRIEQLIWNEDDDPDGKVAHIAEHGIDIDEVEDVLYNSKNRTGSSTHPGRTLTCDSTETGRFLRVAWEHASENPLIVKPVTAFESIPPRGGRRG